MSGSPSIVGVALFVAFVLVETRRPATALVDIRLLRRRPVASSSAVLFLSGASLYGSMLLLPLFFQTVRGLDVLAAALVLIPQGVGALLSRTLAGRLTDSLGARVVAIAGFAVMGLATVPFALADASTSEWWLGAVLLVRGFGMGAVMIPVMSVAFVGLERDEVPHAQHHHTARAAGRRRVRRRPARRHPRDRGGRRDRCRRRRCRASRSPSGGRSGSRWWRSACASRCRSGRSLRRR